MLLTEKHLSRGDWEDALDHKSWRKITNLTYRRITKDALDHKSDKFPSKAGTSRWTHIFWAPRTWGADWWESVSFDEITISHFFITGIEWSIFKTLFYLSIWVNPNNSFSLSQWIKIFVSQAAPILLLHKDVQCDSCRCVLKSTAHQNTTAMPSLTVLNTN